MTPDQQRTSYALRSIRERGMGHPYERCARPGLLFVDPVPLFSLRVVLRAGRSSSRVLELLALFSSASSALRPAASFWVSRIPWVGRVHA